MTKIKKQEYLTAKNVVKEYEKQNKVKPTKKAVCNNHEWYSRKEDDKFVCKICGEITD